MAGNLTTACGTAAERWSKVLGTPSPAGRAVSCDSGRHRAGPGSGEEKEREREGEEKIQSTNGEARLRHLLLPEIGDARV